MDSRYTKSLSVILNVMGFIAREHLIYTGFLVLSLCSQNIWTGLLLSSAMVISYYAWESRDFIYRSYLTLGRDLGGLKLLLSVRYDLHRRFKQNQGVHRIFLDIVRKHPNKLAIQEVQTGREVTFKELNALGNKFAHHFQQLGYKKDDVVALFMENSIEFVACWIGLAKLGIVTAWVNSSLKKEQLAHCIHTSGTNAIVCSRSLAYVLKASNEEGYLKKEDLKFYVCDLGDKSECPVEISTGSFINLSQKLVNMEDKEPTTNEVIDFKSVLCFIYTSGTTGLPKAAFIKHFRYYSMAVGSAMSFGIYPKDKIYISMPLYHTAAGIIGIGQTVLRGSGAVIRQKFSASNFWKDCQKYDCTASQYIGEICRYLLAQPPVSEEKQHKLRLMYGNGLRAEIWQEFVNRFGVQIGEVYGSTEGTSNLVNTDGKVGACGFLPISPLTSRMHPVRLIKVDEATGEVIRQSNGLCIPCRPGETGAMVSTIRKSNPLLIFEGYLNKSETNKKVLHDVFQKGDSVFLSGDILHWDRLGYVYFRDRTGDTYRWKGENVSTTEVEKVFYSNPEIRQWIDDVTVYGIRVPHTEGRAGMAAVAKNKDSPDTDQDFVNRLAQHLCLCLMGPAIPLFIRLCDNVQKTGTYKLIKTDLQRLGLDVTADNDRLFIFDQATRSYQPLTKETRQQLDEGRLGL
ncbi:Long-chain fatty acid transport protein 4 [Aphelenchoides bicaudatus]|nr:Long-chain fatty acid transport protein 4 [Aphelenchoides bicaudatus]